MLDSLYDRVVANWPYSEALLWAGAFWSAHDLAWYIGNGLLYLVYHYNLFPQYKIQPADKWPDRNLVIKCLISCLFKNNVLSPLTVCFLFFPFFRFFGCETYTPIPHWTTFLWQITACFIINDFLFYWAHRFLHLGFIYKHVHKKHHLFKQSIGIASEFAHPFEDIIAAAIPTLLPPMILSCHLSVIWVYIFLREWETLDAHSGYSFPWSVWNLFPWLNGGPNFHDFHHSVNIGNFGMLRFWDWALGTDIKYRTFMEKKTA